MRVGPKIWPGHDGVQPSDLSAMVPMGNGLGVPLIAFPWGGPASPHAYGLHPHHADPRLCAPITEDVGGAVYFGRWAKPADLDGLWNLLEVTDDLDYAAFLEEPPGPGRFGVQLRLVSGFALDHLFRVPKSVREPQPIGMRAALHRFIAESVAARVNLAGWLGGDGDWAHEQLGFGFCVENAYHRVYRIWTRPWLCTK